MRCVLCSAVAFALALGGACAVADSGDGKPMKKLVYGINIVWGISGGDADWTRGDKHQKLLAAAKDIGVTNTRMGINWISIEPEQGKFDWTELDERIDFVRSAGIEVFAIVATTPLWATGLEKEALDLVREKYPGFLGVLPCADEHLDDWAAFCTAFARRYKGKVSHYEIGNEDDGCPAPIVIRDYTGRPVDVRIGGEAGIYTKRLKTAYEAIKKVDPDAIVSTSGLSAGGSTDFLEQIYANGGRGYFDAVAIHPYRDQFERGISWQWLDQTEDLLKYMGDCGKKFWLTEWGYGVNQNDPKELEKHAAAVEQVLLRMERKDSIEQASLHTLNDWRSDESNPKSVQWMGLMTYDLQPKPAYYAYKRAAHGQAQLRDDFLTQPEPPKPHEPGGGEPVRCPFTRTAPTLDGRLDEWNSALRLELVDKEDRPGAWARLMWDADKLYMAVRVPDEQHYQPYGGEWMWRGDSVQIAFDPDRETRKWPGYGYDDTEYGFCLTPAGVQGFRFHGGVDFPNGWVTPFADEPVAARTPFEACIRCGGSETFYEIAMPWTEITKNAVAEGNVLGVSIAANNYDGAKDRVVYGFGSGITAGKDPSLFRPVALAGSL